MSHDFKEQRAETFETFAAMEEGVVLPKEAVLYYQFYAEEMEPDWNGAEAALGRLGFACERDEEEGLLVASFGPIPVTPEAIWKEEKRATEAVLPFDFVPDGWELVTEE